MAKNLKELSAVILTLIITGIVSSPVFSAFIANIDNTILIEGEIKEGDYVRFLDVVLSSGLRSSEVYVSSPGGNVSEAIKIGRLINQLRFQTEVPSQGANRESQCYFSIVVEDQLNRGLSTCTCMSACVLIYLGGVERQGNYLGVHRAFVDHDYLKTMTSSEAQQMSQLINQEIEKYFTYVEAPSVLLDEMKTISSSKIHILDEQFIKNYLEGPTPSIEEWLNAKCGDAMVKYSDTLESNRLSNEERRGIWDKISDIGDCKLKALQIDRTRRFYDVISTALTDLELSQVPENSRTRKAINQLPFKIYEVLGKPVNDARYDLQVLGFGSWKYNPERWRKDRKWAMDKDHHSVLIADGLDLWFGWDDLIVQEIDIKTAGAKSRNPDTETYNGSFGGDLPVDWDVKTPFALFGEPAQIGELKSPLKHTKYFMFKEPKFWLTTFVEPNTNELISISFTTPGQLPEIFHLSELLTKDSQK